jgi:hypothetical protein
LSVADDDDHEDFTTACAEAVPSDAQPIISTILDALAEIVCRKKYTSSVTCTHLIRREDDCTIVLARNFLKLSSSE